MFHYLYFPCPLITMNSTPLNPNAKPFFSSSSSSFSSRRHHHSHPKKQYRRGGGGGGRTRRVSEFTTNNNVSLNPNAKPFFSSSSPSLVSSHHHSHPKKQHRRVGGGQRRVSEVTANNASWACLPGATTTVMIRNIPNKFLRKDMVNMLDQHCRLENAKAVTPKSQFDFVYIPIDFKTRVNKGYAFVNMTSSEGAARLCTAFHNFKWNAFSSNKICRVTMAKIQGRDALEKSLRKRVFHCHTDEYLPVMFWPPRDGSEESRSSKHLVVGMRRTLGH